MTLKTRKWTALLAGLAFAALPVFAVAQEEGGTKTARELRADYDKSLKGKTIAYLPIALGVPLSDEWGRVVQEEAEWRGMKYVVRDPNNNPSAMQQALTALVDQKPDVLIVQNPSVTLLMKDLKRAESQGTHVIQINMSSNYSPALLSGPTGTRLASCWRPRWSSNAERDLANPARYRSCRVS
jgi:ribose transport system substrate-binding protein